MDFSGRCVTFLSEEQVERWLQNDSLQCRKRFIAEVQHAWSDAAPKKHRCCWAHHENSTLDDERAPSWECLECGADLSRGKPTIRATLVCSRCKLALVVARKTKLA